MSNDTTPAMVTQLDGEPVEIQVSSDMVKRGLLVASHAANGDSPAKQFVVRHAEICRTIEYLRQHLLRNSEQFQ